MDTKRAIAGCVAFSLAAPYLGSALKNPSGPLPDVPKTLAFKALQAFAASTSSSGASNMVVFDTMFGHEISVAPRFDQNPRPAFIAPKLTSLSA